jgi:hypothetical protein
MVSTDSINIALSNGYVKKGYGYTKVTKENTHWITFFDNSLQMYGYFTEDEDFDKVYDTGIVNVSDSELETLIKIFTTNYD